MHSGKLQREIFYSACVVRHRVEAPLIFVTMDSVAKADGNDANAEQTKTNEKYDDEYHGFLIRHE